ncbi:Prepilin-type N-terminal cleavage/methylation domain-containing protein OS=Singulisphaera acidiphila (strain ATCC BAA-1392 / DSM 18658 / VKM B-2454 / MOB10) GN=Sinac_3384 PE=4 SV=1: SBP_bac_10 [Gemmata massiliana]|uniref:DUF1559 domain-containing protein n=1 Tax=Gemmata massiliana TaxID=1210884 RepID=A0A6P2DKE9_9BACT|nr:DUF1559 domain-containing protein [Gemmata massiliana]VTS02828.1 Prepilin-type N-terminal cleavage/methylation domain-containing protein OS=Singulisphaera acidiphila (strain ATCC BAA-1392 / DSM 18658 / VKM B-2454 / MOB10) GN=Sinac_3384 PE=4 SV=1: SBP_bac_10 [Gemmata massiliana]
MRRPSRCNRRGGTLLEVLGAVTIVAVLAGLLLPALQKAREASTRTKCQNNLKQLALAAHSFHTTRHGFPAGEIAFGSRTGAVVGEDYYTCWVIPLLPFIGEENRAKAMAETTEFADRHQGGRSSLYGAPIRTLICPSDTLPVTGAFEYHSPDPTNPTHDARFPVGRYDAVCSYGANWGTRTFRYHPSEVAENNGVFHYNTRTRVTDISDGISSTILFGERSHREPRWQFMGAAYPAQQNFAVFARWYTGGVFTGRQPHEMINYRLPPSVESTPPTQGTPQWNDLFHKRLGSYGSEHLGGCNIVLADGSVRFVADVLTLTTLHALSTKSGGETILAE